MTNSFPWSSLWSCFYRLQMINKAPSQVALSVLTVMEMVRQFLSLFLLFLDLDIMQMFVDIRASWMYYNSNTNRKMLNYAANLIELSSKYIFCVNQLHSMSLSFIDTFSDVNLNLWHCSVMRPYLSNIEILVHLTNVLLGLLCP